MGRILDAIRRRIDDARESPPFDTDLLRTDAHDRDEAARNALEDAAEAGDGDYDAFMESLEDDPRVNVTDEDEKEQ